MTDPALWNVSRAYEIIEHDVLQVYAIGRLVLPVAHMPPFDIEADSYDRRWPFCFGWSTCGGSHTGGSMWVRRIFEVKYTLKVMKRRNGARRSGIPRQSARRAQEHRAVAPRIPLPIIAESSMSQAGLEQNRSVSSRLISNRLPAALRAVELTQTNYPRPKIGHQIQGDGQTAALQRAMHKGVL